MDRIIIRFDLGTDDLQPGPLHRIKYAEGAKLMARIQDSAATDRAGGFNIDRHREAARNEDFRQGDSVGAYHYGAADYTAQENEIKMRFQADQQKLRDDIATLKNEIELKTAKRDELDRIAQEEADGTGGTRKRNAGP
ncbi:MAG TPA: hypothetical protein VF141_11820, partial [Chryseolinea sp.]